MATARCRSYHTERIGPDSTQTMVRDCGPGAHPILWGSSGITESCRTT